MDAIEAIKSRRTIRRFKQTRIERAKLLELIDCARRSPAGGNFQAIEYVIVDEPQICKRIFACLAWAGHVRPRRNPAPHQEPTAYIVVLADNEIKKYESAAADAAAAIENILIAAHAMGIGSCWLGSVNRDEVRNILQVPDNFTIDSVIALGVPDESPVMDDCSDHNTKYRLDENDVLHVPKRTVESITHFNSF